MDDESFFTHTLEQTNAHRIHEKTMLTKKKAFPIIQNKKKGHVCPPSLWRPFWTSLEFYYLKKTNGLWFLLPISTHFSLWHAKISLVASGISNIWQLDEQAPKKTHKTICLPEQWWKPLITFPYYTGGWLIEILMICLVINPHLLPG